MSLLDHLAQTARATPALLSLVDAHGSCTRAQLWRRVQVCAERLQQLGVQRVSSELDNGIDAVVIDLALRLAGAVHLPLPGFFTAAQIRHAQLSVGADAHIGMASGIASVALTERSRITHLTLTTASPTLAAGSALVTFTSGSTGTPKGVCLRAEHLDQVAISIVDALAGHTPQRHLCLLPLAVLLEQVAGVWAGLYAGATVVLPPLAKTGMTGAAQLDATQMASCIDAHRPESLILVPQMLQAWMAALAAGAQAPASLRFIAVGGARVGAQLLARAAGMGLPVFEGYGLSECGSVVCLNRPGAARTGSVGRPLGHVRLELAADGELLVHGPRFAGYVGETDDGCGAYRTGDLCQRDSDGYVAIHGRKRNVYITAFGRNVSPEWVETELTQHPLIAQAVISGEARASNAAVLVLRQADASDSTVRAALDQVNAGLPDYAKVHHWLRAAEPFTPANAQLTDNGRVRRDRVLARYAAALDQFYPATA